MQEYTRYTESTQVDMESECLYRFVYGATDIFAPHCHDYYEIFLTVSGTVTHWINGMTCKLPEGTLVFIRPDDVHGYIYDNPQSAETTYVNLTFTQNTMDQLFTYLSDSFPSEKLLRSPMPPSVTLSQAEKKRLLHQISELDLVKWQDKHALKLRMRVLLADIFARSFYALPEPEAEEQPLWFSQLTQDMEQPEHFAAGIECMITLSGKTREHLSRCIRKYLGVTATEYINDLRINYASNLLINTNAPILDICFTCGFQNVSRFYQVFKKKYDKTPSEFRKLYQV